MSQCRRSTATWRRSTRRVVTARWCWLMKLATDEWSSDAASRAVTVTSAARLTSVTSSTLAAPVVVLASSSFQIRRCTASSHVQETSPPISIRPTPALKVVLHSLVVDVCTRVFCWCLVMSTRTFRMTVVYWHTTKKIKVQIFYYSH